MAMFPLPPLVHITACPDGNAEGIPCQSPGRDNVPRIINGRRPDGNPIVAVGFCAISQHDTAGFSLGIGAQNDRVRFDPVSTAADDHTVLAGLGLISRDKAVISSPKRFPQGNRIVGGVILVISGAYAERMGCIIVIDMHPVDNQIRKSKPIGKSNIIVKRYRPPERSGRIGCQIPLVRITLISDGQAFGKHSIVIDGRPCPNGSISQQQHQQYGPGQQRSSFSSVMDRSALCPVVSGNFRDHHPDAPNLAPNDFVDFVHVWKPLSRKMQKSPFLVFWGPEGGFSSIPK